jgi:hypothetical protein
MLTSPRFIGYALVSRSKFPCSVYCRPDRVFSDVNFVIPNLGKS